MRRPVSRAEGGFTMVESAIAMALTVSVMAVLLGIVVSQTKAEKRVSTFAENQELLRQAIVALQRDVRSSQPPNALPTAPELALRLDMNLYDSLRAPPVPIRWKVDTAIRELRREQLDSNGNVVGVTHRLSGVVNTSSDPLFTFYGRDTPATSSTPATPAAAYDLTVERPEDVVACTVRIHISLAAAPNPGPGPVRLQSDVQLRNRPVGSNACGSSTTTGP